MEDVWLGKSYKIAALLSPCHPSTPRWKLRQKAEELASECGMDIASLLGHGQSRVQAAQRRKLAIYLRGLGMSFPRIGTLMGRDHTTVMNYTNPDAYREKKRRNRQLHRDRKKSLKESAQQVSPTPSSP